MPPLIRLGGCLEDKDYEPLVKPPPTVSFDTVRTKVFQLNHVTMTYVIPEYTPVSQQGNASTCVANMLCDACEMLLGLDHGPNKVVQLSRRHLYWVARATHGTTNWDSGTHIHAGAWQLQEVGVCEEKYFPYSDEEEDLVTSPPLNTYSMASANRVKGHLRLTTRGRSLGSDIEQSIRFSHPIGFGTTVTRSFQRYRGEGVFDVPDDALLGRHAMLIVGVRYVNNERQFLLRNSWGTLWGDNGHAWVTERFITRRDSSDFWMLTRMQLID